MPPKSLKVVVSPLWTLSMCARVDGQIHHARKLVLRAKQLHLLTFEVEGSVKLATAAAGMLAPLVFPNMHMFVFIPVLIAESFLLAVYAIGTSLIAFCMRAFSFQDIHHALHLVLKTEQSAALFGPITELTSRGALRMRTYSFRDRHHPLLFVLNTEPVALIALESENTSLGAPSMPTINFDPCNNRHALHLMQPTEPGVLLSLKVEQWLFRAPKVLTLLGSQIYHAL